MSDFEYLGINHLALVCKDMDRTVDFYVNTLGMPLTKTIELPNGRGKHYFFDCGGGDQLAFFWFPNGPDAVDEKEFRRITATPGTMNHVAFNVAPEKIDEYREKLAALGIEVTDVVNHDDSEAQASEEISPSTFVRSIYFKDPDGTQLEFAAWARPLTEADVVYPAEEAANGSS
jgi:catechol 2,3-dioxygenase-like lactoylglutathione lyase family enzyme